MWLIKKKLLHMYMWKWSHYNVNYNPQYRNRIRYMNVTVKVYLNFQKFQIININIIQSIFFLIIFFPSKYRLLDLSGVWAQNMGGEEGRMCLKRRILPHLVRTTSVPMRNRTRYIPSYIHRQCEWLRKKDERKAR